MEKELKKFNTYINKKRINLKFKWLAILWKINEKRFLIRALSMKEAFSKIQNTGKVILHLWGLLKLNMKF